MKASGIRTDKKVCSGSLISFSLKCTCFDCNGLPPSLNCLNWLMKKASSSVILNLLMISLYFFLVSSCFFFRYFLKALPNYGESETVLFYSLSCWNPFILFQPLNLENICRQRQSCNHLPSKCTHSGLSCLSGGSYRIFTDRLCCCRYI